MPRALTGALLGSRSLRWGVKRGSFWVAVAFVEIVDEYTRCTLVQGDTTHLSQSSPFFFFHISMGSNPRPQRPS